MIARSAMFITTQDATTARSPSLRATDDPAQRAYEMKFLLEEAAASRIEERLRSLEEDASRHPPVQAPRPDAWLLPDPHGDPAQGGAYRVRTLYLDTPALDVLHRSRGFRRTKHRLRRYGDEDLLHLERKRRRKDRVHKDRVAIPAEEHPLLAASVVPPDWVGAAFRDDVHRLGLLPSAQVTYLRRAWCGLARSGALRVTIDRDLAGGPCSSWCPPIDSEPPDLLPGWAVLEMKFEAALPPLLQRLLADFRLQPMSLSKYRVSRTAITSDGSGDRPPGGVCRA